LPLRVLLVVVVLLRQKEDPEGFLQVPTVREYFFAFLVFNTVAWVLLLVGCVDGNEE
jgi:hypothetical protein